jgi:nucleoside-diphosphate-sugar epimerase
MAILLTGSGGFLGGILAKRLLAAGYSVVGINRRSSGRLNWVNSAGGSLKILPLEEFNAEQLFKDNKIDVIIHTASSYGLGDQGLSDAINGNLTFPLKLIETALRFGKPALINADTFFNKNNQICEYMFPYCFSKYSFDQLVRKMSDCLGFQYVNLRLEHMYGAGENPGKFCTFVVSACLDNVSMLKLTKGEQKRDFIHVDDVATAFLTILDRLLSKQKLSREYSVGCGSSISLKEFVEKVREITQSDTIVEYGAIDYFQGELMYSQGSIEGLLDLGWEPKVSLSEGILQYVDAEGQNDKTAG